MIALILVAALAAQPAPAESPHRLDVDASFAYGFSGGHSLGGFVEGRYGLRLWEAGSISGTLEAGLMLGYQAEPYSLYGNTFGDAKLSGGNHRLESWLVLGHCFRFPPSERVSLSVQLFGGWSHLLVRGALDNPVLGVSGESNADAGVFATGVMLQYGLRLTDRVGLSLRVIAPFPYALDVNPWILASLGVSVRLF